MTSRKTIEQYVIGIISLVLIGICLNAGHTLRAAPEVDIEIAPVDQDQLRLTLVRASQRHQEQLPGSAGAAVASLPFRGFRLSEQQTLQLDRRSWQLELEVGTLYIDRTGDEGVLQVRYLDDLGRPRVDLATPQLTPESPFTAGLGPAEGGDYLLLVVEAGDASAEAGLS